MGSPGLPYHSAISLLYGNPSVTHSCMPLHVGYERVERGTRTYRWDNSRRGLQAGDACIFQYTVSGQGVFADEHGTHDLPTGHAFLVGLPSRTRYWLAPGCHWELLYLNFRGRTARELLDDLVAVRGHVLKLTEASCAVELVTGLYGDAVSGKRLSPYEASVRLYRFLLSLHEETTRGAADTDVAIARALEYVRVHVADPDVSLDRMASVANLSKFHFARRFKQAVGMSPGAYVRELRLLRARDLLAFGHPSVKEVGAEVGFRYASHFCAAFRKRFGVSPGKLNARIGRPD